MGLLGLAVVALGVLLALQIQKNNSQPPVRPKPVAAAPAPPPAAFAPQTSDDQEIARLSKEYSDAEASRDTNGVYALFSETVKTNLNPQNLFIDGAPFDFEKLESVRYRNGGLGKSAQATVKRRAQTGLGTQENVRELQFVKEAGRWRLFPVLDLAKKAVNDFASAGFSAAVDRDLDLLRAGDAFNGWDANETNAFEAAFKLAQHRDGIFPWDLDFSVESNRLDNLILAVSYRIRNRSAVAWNSPLLEFHLKQNGQTLLTADDILPDVPAGQSAQHSVSFLLAKPLLQTTQYTLDISHPLGLQHQLPLVQDVPVEARVPLIAELAKLEVTGTQFDAVTNNDNLKQLAARINFRVTNIGAEPIQNLDVECFWCNFTGEPLDQATEYLVGPGEPPLATGQSRTGWVRCGKGDAKVKTPVKADLYLQAGDQRALVQKDLLIR